jgi:hypothetical protein
MICILRITSLCVMNRLITYEGPLAVKNYPSVFYCS